MGLVLKNTTIDTYFRFLTRLDINSKKRLIVKLTESIEREDKSKIDLNSLCGSWEDSRSSDEINRDIKMSRAEKKTQLTCNEMPTRL